jgi:hypothetical protein
LVTVISGLICRLPLIEFAVSAGILLHVGVIIVLHPYLVVASLVHHGLTTVHFMGFVIVNAEVVLVFNRLHLARMQVNSASFIMHDLSGLLL